MSLRCAFKRLQDHDMSLAKTARNPKEWEIHGSRVAVNGSVEVEGNEVRKLLWRA